MSLSQLPLETRRHRIRRVPLDEKLAVAYVRVSTDKQENGPEAQRIAIERWAESRGVRVVAWHSEIDVSGTKSLDEREQLFRAITDLYAYRAGLLLVAKRDRLARDTLVAGLVDRNVAMLGGRVVSTDPAGDQVSPEAAFMRAIVDAAAAFEVAQIRGRVKAALAVRRMQGRPAGKAPFGYRSVPDPTGRVTVKGKRDTVLAPEPAEQACIARVLELAAGPYSQRGIVRMLEREGFRSRKNTPLTRIQVQRILKAKNVTLADP